MVEQHRVGTEVVTRYGWKGVVTEYLGWDNCTVKWQDGEITTHVRWNDIKLGNMKPRNQPVICGVGYLGKGKYITSERYRLNENEIILPERVYSVWDRMLKRSCSDMTALRTDAYLETSCSPIWYNLQNFADWCLDQEGFWMKDEKGHSYELDKDLLVPMNKEYHPEKCIFLPKELNSFLEPHKRGGRLEGNGIGSYFSYGSYQAQCSNPLTKKLTALGRFRTLQEAEEAYFKEKNRLAKMLADKWEGFVDGRAIQALRERDMRDYYYV